jgi:hypothetical protein
MATLASNGIRPHRLLEVWTDLNSEPLWGARLI